MRLNKKYKPKLIQKNFLKKPLRKTNFLYKNNDRYLFPLEKKHILKLKEWRNTQMKILRQHILLTDFSQERWYAHLKEDKSQTLFALMYCTSKKMKFIGYCGITNIDFKNRRGEISFLVNPTRVTKKEVYKKDFLAVLNMLCKHGFEGLNLNKLFTETFEFRKEHIKILEKFSFRKEGELREHYFCNGEYLNSFIHSILSSEWKLLKNKKYAMEK